MLGLKSFFGGSSEGAARKLRPLAERINALEPSLEKLSNEELRERMAQLKARLSKEDVEDILPEVFASVREAAKRTLGQRHFDVQLIGGMVLHQGKIAEMKTGEGKTLVATLPASLNALTGKGVHIVTVNDYLARRDTTWMGPIYHLLGLSVGCLQHESAYLYDPTHENENPSLRYLRPVPRREAYQADITYGTNNEFGFDYLRDNMALDLSQTVQREQNYAIVDEVDNILIDEARTPLIISGPAQEPVQLYSALAKIVPRLHGDDDYTIDEKTKAVTLSEEGIAQLEGWLKVGNLYAPENYHLVNYVENAVKAQVLYQRDREYVVKDGQVVIVDEFTGRLMFGRRYSDGLHQAIEAKEGVKVQQESITYATITLQNYFRMYKKLAGMTGTAATESEEFYKIYGLEVVVIPTHKLMIREDHSDFIYKTEEAKFRAVAKEIEELNKKGRPALVGTTSIEKSEKLSGLLDRRGIRHQVLNAKFHEKEAVIVTQAGRPGAVTVATNMAGRGTDIILGGNPAGLDITPEQWQKDHELVVSLGGLHVIGTEHHEARRIDNQLRGRSGRQGDPGSTRFYASLEDELMRRFGGDRIKSFMDWAGLDEDTPLENRLVTKALGSAQVKVEGYHFEIRKHLLEYDDVLNKHREIIYAERHKILSGADLKANVLEMVRNEIKEMVGSYLGDRDPDNWNVKGLVAELQGIFPLPKELKDPSALSRFSRDEVLEKLTKYAEELYQEREAAMGSENMRLLERLVMLRVIDTHWVNHLTAMENLRQGIGLHAYGQRDPLTMYKTEGHQMFQNLKSRMQHDIASTIYRVAMQAQASTPVRRNDGAKASPMAAVMGQAKGREPVAAGSSKVGRNDPCPCGSGKKYKRCHGT